MINLVIAGLESKISSSPDVSIENPCIARSQELGHNPPDSSVGRL
ncbi:MAG: hypothetical protein WCD53_21245 [Microcoleus sp.]